MHDPRNSRPRRPSGKYTPPRPAVLAAILGLAILVVLGNWIGFLERPPAVNSPAGLNGHLLDIGVPMTARRVNYNHSVIPGGAFTGQELQRAVDGDAVVAEHYRDVNASAMRPEVLKSDRLAYVSYRLNNRVYWTSKKVRIRSGEKILTDGRTQIRARCGNCISMEPLMPTSPDEPDPMQLDALIDTGPVLVAWPLNPLAPLAPGDPIGLELAPLVAPQVGLAPVPFSGGFSGGYPGGATLHAGPVGPKPGTFPIVGAALDPSTPGGTMPPGGAVPPNGAAPSTTTGPTLPGFSADWPFPPNRPDSLFDKPTIQVTPTNDPGRATPVPEPATLLLVGGGVAGLIARRWRSRRV